MRETSSSSSGHLAQRLATFLAACCNFTVVTENHNHNGIGCSCTAEYELPAGSGIWFQNYSITGGQQSGDGSVTLALGGQGASGPLSNMTPTTGTWFVPGGAAFIPPGIGYADSSPTAGWSTGHPTGFSFTTLSKQGANGTLNPTGTDKDLEDTTAASFVVGDVGKSVVIQDTVNPRNSGIYLIAAYISATKVTLNFQSAAAEYPTQNLGANLNWGFLSTLLTPIRGDKDTPTPFGYIRLRSPHANAWEIEIQYHTQGTDQRLTIRVAPDGNWSGSKILSSVHIGSDDSKTLVGYCAADDGGEFINFFFHNSSDSVWGGFYAGNMQFTEPGRTGDETVVLMGNQVATGFPWRTTSTYGREYSDTSKITTGTIWDEMWEKLMTVSMVDLSSYLTSNSLNAWTSRQINQRTGNWDFVESQPVLLDVDNALTPDAFEILGVLPGFLLCSQQATDKTAYDDDATRDRFHVMDGHAIEWPGVTEQH